MTPGQIAGVYPGSFDPLTVAHLAIAEAAVHAAGLERLDFAISRDALGKSNHAWPISHRINALARAAETRPWMTVVETDFQLIVDIARGYDAVVIGADKWAQVQDPAWYGGDAAARDAALALLPRILVAPRPGFSVEGAEVLAIDPEHADVSSSRVRGGEHHLMAPEAKRRLIIDGNNVIGSRPDGWWRNRSGAARTFVEEVQRYASRTPDPIAVVFDGTPLRNLPEGVHSGVLVAYARRGGRNAADDRIIEEITGDPDPQSLTVVTSDRDLRRRAEELGARIARPSWFIGELESELP